MNDKRRWFISAFSLLIIGGLVAWALKNAPLPDIWATIRRLQLWQIVLLVLLNGLLYCLVSLRWWMNVKQHDQTHAVDLS